MGVIGGSVNPTNTNVPELLGQVFGTLAIPRLRVRLEITWILRRNGKVLRESKDFIAMDGLASPNVSLLVPPIFDELRLDTLTNPKLELACLSARVRLTLGSVHQVYDLPAIPILLLPLLIPTVVAMFSEPNFGVAHQGFALLMVPQHSALSSAEQLFSILNKIQDVIEKLAGLASFAGWVLGLNDLTDTFAGQPRLRFISADRISDFKDVTVRARRLFELGDLNFDDEAKSILMIGLPRTVANFYNDTDWRAQRTDTIEGSYSLTIPRDTLYVMVRDLKQAAPSQAPPTFPPGWSRLFRPDTDIQPTWAGSLSSFEFEQQWLEGTALEAHLEVLEPVLDCALVRIIGTRRLRDLTLKELRAKVRARGIEGTSRMTRPELERALRYLAPPVPPLRKA